MASKRWAALDGLRGVAILLVLIGHFDIADAAVGGMVGVTLFFVLSGFLITYLLIEEKEGEGRIRLKAFYGRRALRLLPALAVYLAGIALLIWVRQLSIPIWEITWPPAFYVANYVQIFGHDLVLHRHLWSLAVEEHFYLVWPVFVILGATRRLKLLALAVGLLVTWRVASGLVNPVWTFMATDTNAYALGLGCLLAALRQRGTTFGVPERSAELAVVILILLSLMPYTDLESLYQVGIWVPVLAAAASALAVWAAVDARPAFLTGKVIVWFGGISYALYLWHAPLLQIPGLADNSWTRLFALALAVGLAWLSWTIVEGPILRSRLRQRLVPKGRVPGMQYPLTGEPGVQDHHGLR